MKRIAWIWTAIAALVCVLAVAAAFGRFHHGGGRFGKRPEAALERGVARLGLDATRSERVRAILDTGRSQQRDVRDQLDVAFAEMRQLLDQDDPDEAAVLEQAERIGGLQTQADKARLRTLIAVRAELTVEERAKLRQDMDFDPGRRRGRRRAPPDE